MAASEAQLLDVINKLVAALIAVAQERSDPGLCTEVVVRAGEPPMACGLELQCPRHPSPAGRALMHRVVRESYGDNWRGPESGFDEPATCAALGPWNDRCGLLEGHAGRHIGAHAGPWADDTEAREIELYGPPLNRWGDPSKPCPFLDESGPCSLRLNHAGPHRDGDGLPLGITADADGVGVSPDYRLTGEPYEYITPTGAVIPAVTPEDMCTCGNPAEHQPGCPRYRRMSGGPVTDGEPT